ncbi:hypothetical protein SHIRM173S_05313 [Streptomyces hirsutus]
MFVEAETASWRTSRVHFTPSRWKCAVSTPSFFIRPSTYRRVELLDPTPDSRTNASDNVRAPPPPPSSRSSVYALVPIESPPFLGHPFAASYGVTNRLSDGHARQAERPVPGAGTGRSRVLRVRRPDP